MSIAKDEVLAQLSERANVAQFVSFGPGSEPDVRFARLYGHSFDEPFSNVDEALAALLSSTSHGSVNIRTFRVAEDEGTSAGKGHDFHYGLDSVDELVALVRRHAGEGLHTIANETIPVDDGGVSGVALGGSVEFSPDDTPRCVEKSGTLGLPYAEGVRLLETVYGFRPDLDVAAADERLEWSIHPRRVGLRRSHTLVWELERVGQVEVDVQPSWPNNFSRLLGDKTFGLLLADLFGVPVPRTLAVGRRVAPFGFGRPTGSGERWLRTAPREPVPGRYPTLFGWEDPFALLEESDPTHEVGAVLAQDSVDAVYSGALLPGDGKEPIIEGVAGHGDDFMLGRGGPESLPEEVTESVATTADKLTRKLGPVRIEWVFDGVGTWVVQLQQALTTLEAATIVGGDAREWRTFDTSAGLEALRALIDEVRERGEGIVLQGDVGVTSHFGDILRRAGVPSRLAVPVGADSEG